MVTVTTPAPVVMVVFVALGATNANCGNRVLLGLAVTGMGMEALPLMPSFSGCDPQGVQSSPLQGHLWVPRSKSIFPKQLR